MTTAEKRVAAVFVLGVLLRIINPLLGIWIGPDTLSDTGIAIAGALLLFVVPAGGKGRIFSLDWSWAKRAPWDILILFGGGLSLAQAVDQAGLATWIGSGLAMLGDLPPMLIVAGTAS